MVLGGKTKSRFLETLEGIFEVLPLRVAGAVQARCRLSLISIDLTFRCWREFGSTQINIGFVYRQA